MVKKRPRDLGLELCQQVNLLSSQFGKTVGLGGDYDNSQAQRSDEGQVMNWSSANWSSASSGQTKSSVDSDSVTDSVNSAPADLQTARALISPPPKKYSILGFEVDFTGSQKSDTPFLIPKVGTLMGRDPASLHRVLRIRDELDAKRKLGHSKCRWLTRRRDERVHGGYAVSKVLHSARKKLLTDLSLMVPGSIQEIKGLNPVGNRELSWDVVKAWLQERPSLMSQMKLTTGALKLISQYTGPPLEAGSLQSLKCYATLVCERDSETYKDVCFFLFPEDKQFSRGGSF